MNTQSITGTRFDQPDERTASHLPDWLDIVIHPRSAIERILYTHTLFSAMVLSMVTTLAAATAQLARHYPRSQTAGAESLAASGFPLWLLPASVLLAPIGLLLVATILTAVGQLLYGGGNTREVMLAVSWSSIPCIAGSALLVAAAWTGMAMSTPAILATILTGAGYALFAWSLGLLVVTIAQVNVFSWGRALLTVLLFPAIAGALVGLLGVLFARA
jgi:hypothetical protein